MSGRASRIVQEFGNLGLLGTSANLGDTKNAWTLLRSYQLSRASDDAPETKSLKVHATPPCNMSKSNQIRLERLSIYSEGVRALTAVTPFKCVRPPAEIQGRSESDALTWICSSRHGSGSGDGDDRITLNIYARLEKIYWDLLDSCKCVPKHYELHWRLRPGNVFQPAFADDGVSLQINCLEVDGAGDATPPTSFTQPLQPHQRRSLAWMKDREESRELFVCEQCLDRPIGCSGIDLRLELRFRQAFNLRGGLLCDPVGSGKTATILALICGACDTSDQLRETYLNASLVFCPANVHQHWLDEIKKFCPASLSVCALRTMSDFRDAQKEQLVRADVVVASYELLSNVSDGAHLTAYSWRRVVLDEIHELVSDRHFNKFEVAMRSLYCLRSEKRWGVTGTPDVILRSHATMMRCARLFRVDLSRHSATSFAEQFFRQSRVEIRVPIYEHLHVVKHTCMERAIYLSAAQDHRIPAVVTWNDVKPFGTRLQDLMQLCSHFNPNNLTGALEATAQSVGGEILKSKIDARNAAERDLAQHVKLMWSHCKPLVCRRLVEQGLVHIGTSNKPEGLSFPLVFTDICRSAADIVKNWKESGTPSSCKKRDLEGLLEYLNLTSSYRKRDLEGLFEYFNLLAGFVEPLNRFLFQLSDSARSLDFFNTMWYTLANTDNTEALQCPVCLEQLDLPRSCILRCGHAVCVDCLQRLRQAHEGRNASCPLCRAPVVDFNHDVMKLLDEVKREVHEEKPANQCWGSKLVSVVEQLEAVWRSDAKAKIILFSQWDSLRSKVSAALSQIGMNHLLLQGNIFERTHTIQSFKNDSDVRLLLLSLEDSASGTNLTVASHVFLLHPMLASTADEALAFEAQAIGRVRRIGQERPVHVRHFITYGTVEKQLYDALHS